MFTLILLVFTVSGCAEKNIAGKATEIFYQISYPTLQLRTPLGAFEFSAGQNVVPKVVSYSKMDEGYMEAIIVYPEDIDPDIAYPAVIVMHGGLERIWDDPPRLVDSVPWLISLAEEGYVAIYPDARHLQYKTKGPEDLLATIRYLKTEQTVAQIGNIGCQGQSAGNMAVWGLVTAYPNKCKAYFGLYPAQDPKNKDFFTSDEQMGMLEAKTLFSVGNDDEPYTGYVEEYETALPVVNPDLDLKATYFEGSKHGFFYRTGETVRFRGKDIQIPYDENSANAQRMAFDFFSYSLKEEQAPPWWAE